MILWTLISGFLFASTFWGRSAKIRRNASIILTAWALASIALLLIGGPAIAD